MKQTDYIKPSPRRGIPKKQDRMFHIELGQNDGPFKDTYENYEAFSMYKSSTKSKEGPTLKEELNREQPENYDTVQNILKRIEEYTIDAMHILMSCKDDETNIRDIHDVVEKDNAITLENLQPLIQKDYKELKQELKKEKEENEHLSKQLLRIRKDFSSMNLQIASCDGKASQMYSKILGEVEQVENNYDL